MDESRYEEREGLVSLAKRDGEEVEVGDVMADLRRLHRQCSDR